MTTGFLPMGKNPGFASDLRGLSRKIGGILSGGINAL